MEKQGVPSVGVLYPCGILCQSEGHWLVLGMRKTHRNNKKSKIPLRSETEILKGNNKILTCFE